MKRLFLLIAGIGIFSLSLQAQTKQDIIIFDEGDTGGTFYDASWGNVTAPSTLALGGGGEKLIVVSIQHYSGSKSGLIQWQSATGGDWKIFIANLGWAAKNATGYDSLIFYLNSRGAILVNQLPTVGLETSGNALSKLVALGSYLSGGTDADTTTWQRVSIPLAIFSGFDLSIFKDVNFHQDAVDNIQHTMWIDNIRIIAKSGVVDTTKPSAPKKVVVRTGDKSTTVHWNRNPEQNISGYNVYRATTVSGPYTNVSNGAVIIQSIADVNVVNGTTYYYFVRAVNTSQVEGSGSDTISAAPKAFADTTAFLNYVEQTSFDYFWYEANPDNGLIKDRSSKDSPASIAAVGFGLTAIGVGVDRGWITRAEGRDRTLITLKTFWEYPQGTAAAGIIGYKGWFYHFLKMDTGERTWDCELSSIDTGLLLAGILYSKQYFNGADTTETKIRNLADSIYKRIDWNWMTNNGSSLSMGWKPASGFLGARWVGYNEAMILYIMGIGAPSNPLPASSWDAWTNGYQWKYSSLLGNYFVNFPPLFGHQYSHCWVDYRDKADVYMKGKGITYFENSRRATLEQRLYCISNPNKFTGYGPNMWGITASDVPTGYNARGTNMNDDGTLNATAPGGSMPFAPEVCIPALRNMYDTYRTTIWTGYGFTDAFNVSVSPVWWDTDVLGIDQGPIVIMMENYRTGNVWKTFMKEKIIIDGLQRAGFTPSTGVSNEKENVPAVFSLQQNYPNPFNPATEISYQLPVSSYMTLKLFDVLGREVATLINEVQSAGKHNFELSTLNFSLSSGVYFYTMQSGSFSETKKMMLLR